ncbi:MAG: 30S ribosomal protein S1 [Candidatus Hydrogenedentes bacterium ADurb.Bin170]|nr:MAG: 30S ribosomal protein S1 [Candidatus Hydrogenedentes bacterium ADurb.Bin170]
MQSQYFSRIAGELKISVHQVQAISGLLAEGATIPFMARYRKEATGSLDEVALTTIRDTLGQLEELDKRREAILKSLEKRDLLTDALKAAVLQAESLAVLEDVYLPWRPKRRTRAAIAREKGLAPLADALLLQEPGDPAELAAAYISEEKGVATAEEALQGARDILAEKVSEDGSARALLRDFFLQEGQCVTRVLKDKEEEGAKFRDYFDWSEKAATVPSHRFLAMLRAEKEGIVSFSITPDREEAIRRLCALFVTASVPASQEVLRAVEDGYVRLMEPSLESETRKTLKEAADREAIRVFADNLKELLMASPLGRKRVLALDPGFRTGCKMVCLDAQGKLLHDSVIYPHSGERAREESGRMLLALCHQYEIEAVAVGNGTAGRETEAFVREVMPDATIPLVMVNESGASIYSASETARSEFPDKDVTVRGAVSIGRRLMDPLAELVKIDPKSIGVGQYQHDVDQARLKQSLEDTVMSCVNSVGVDLNSASRELLMYVSGLGPQLSGNIVAYRNEHGPFSSRAQLKKVPRLGPRAFEQSAGFLRIPEGKNPLDGSAVHPERYGLVDAMAKDLGCTVKDLLADTTLRARIRPENYVSDTVGLPTLYDILEELAKPGRDPRKQFEIFQFSGDVQAIGDLLPGMRLPGIVTNVTAFGAFVDVGVHQDGLVHISQLADHFVRDPNEVVRVQQRVQVTVIEVDVPRKRISLSMKSDAVPSERTVPGDRQKRAGGGKKNSEQQRNSGSISLDLKDKLSAHFKN